MSESSRSGKRSEPEQRKRTPGPWHFSYLTAGEFGVCADGRGLILNVCAASGCINGGATRVEAEANAHLIAAAPELLEAARWAEHALLEQVGACQSYPCTEEEPCSYCVEQSDAANRLRAAIAKAEGK